MTGDPHTPVPPARYPVEITSGYTLGDQELWVQVFSLAPLPSNLLDRLAPALVDITDHRVLTRPYEIVGQRAGWQIGGSVPEELLRLRLHRAGRLIKAALELARFSIVHEPTLGDVRLLQPGQPGSVNVLTVDQLPLDNTTGGLRLSYDLATTPDWALEAIATAVQHAADPRYVRTVTLAGEVVEIKLADQLGYSPAELYYLVTRGALDAIKAHFISGALGCFTGIQLNYPSEPIP